MQHADRVNAMVATVLAVAAHFEARFRAQLAQIVLIRAAATLMPYIDYDIQKTRPNSTV